jgi:hypothetical protein
VLSVILISAGDKGKDGVDFWKKYTAPAITSLDMNASQDYKYEMIVVDNGGCGRGNLNIDVMIPYAEAVNKAYHLVSKDSNRLLILNNDIIAKGDWMKKLYTADLCGPVFLRKEGVDYIEGWALSINRDLWHMLGGFNETYRNSWEDVDLAWRASRLGVTPTTLIKWPIYHFWGATRHQVSGSNKWDEDNRLLLLNRIKASNGSRWKRK